MDETSTRQVSRPESGRGPHPRKCANTAGNDGGQVIEFTPIGEEFGRR